MEPVPVRAPRAAARLVQAAPQARGAESLPKPATVPLEQICVYFMGQLFGTGALSLDLPPAMAHLVQSLIRLDRAAREMGQTPLIQTRGGVLTMTLPDMPGLPEQPTAAQMNRNPPTDQ